MQYARYIEALTRGRRGRFLLIVLAYLPLIHGALVAPSTGLVTGRGTGLAAVGVLVAATPLRRRYLPAYVLVSLVAFLVTGQIFCVGLALYATTRARNAALAGPLAAVPLLIAALQPRTLMIQAGDGALTLSTTSLLLALPVVAGLAVNGMDETARLRTERAKERLLLRDSLIRERRMLQRERLVRTIHNGVGHQVSLMSVQSMAIAARPDTPPEVTVKCDLIQGAGADAMRALQQVLRVMQDDDEQPQLPAESGTAADITELVALYRQYGQRIRADIQLPAGLSADLSELLYQAAEEALSNCIRHANGAWVLVRLRAQTSGVRLTVRNSAPGPHTARLPGTGNGQRQLADVVHRAGGTLTTGPTHDGGYQLTLTLPMGAASAATAAAPLTTASVTG